MSKYPHLKLKLENVSNGDVFSINLVHYTEQHEFDFEFENSTFWIERGLLKFFDNETELQRIELMMINPRERTKTIHKISHDTPFNYTIKGILVNQGDDILLKMKAISYLLERNKKYILKFKSALVTNELEIVFPQ